MITKFTSSFVMFAVFAGGSLHGATETELQLRHRQQAAADVRGTIDYPGMDALVDSNGVQAVGYQFQNDCQKPGPWQAKWIWPDGDKTGEAAMFLKEVVLADAPRTARAWLTADARYRLFVNGRLVSRGPVDMGRDYAGGNTHRWFYDCRDLTPFFVKGTNVIAAEVFRHWTGWTVSRGQPGFLFEAEITSRDGHKTTVATDTNWHSQVAPQFPNFTTLDASKEVPGWRLPGFDDAGWPSSSEVKDMWSPLVASEIPPLMEARYPVLRDEGLPDKVITNETSFRVVFDRVLSGYPVLKVKGGKGAVLTIKANNEAKFILGGGEQCYEFPHMTEIVPAFTVIVKNVTEPLEIEDAGAIFTSQPVQYRGEFACSDDQLNRIWNVSRWAVQICLQTHHLDSPNHQEPISDPGDYLIESMVNYYAFAQPWLTRQDIRKFAWLLKDENYHNFHTSYSIGWLQMLMDYYDYTGDKSLVEEMSPYVHELLDTYTSWRGTNGIISEAPNYMFMDWVKIGGFECHHPPAVIGQGYLTAFYYHGLEMAARVAALTGDTARVEKYKKLRGEIAVAFNRELWNADKGLYRDGKPFQTSVKPEKWLPADKDIETFSPHVNLLAVLYGLAPKEQQHAIVEKVLAEKPLNTQPWFMHWVFQAVDRAGLFDKYGTAQMRRWQIVPETQSFREMWNSGDLSHGWCSTPLVQMSQRVLGVEPASPGFKTMTICPHVCDLTWAKGKVPTPQGEVEVAWTLQNDKFSLDVVVPPGAEADVVLPVSHFENPVAAADGKKSGAQVRVSSGSHHFEVSASGTELDLAPLCNPVWATKDNIRDPSVLKTAAGYHLFYSRFSGQTSGWGDPENWHIAEVFTKDFLTFTNDRNISPAGCASPGDVVWWHGRWVLPYQTYPSKPTQLVFAESTNLVDWNVPRPFLTEALNLPWNELQRVIDPSFVVDGDTLHCWFVGSAYRTNASGDIFKVNLMGHAITRDPKLAGWEILTTNAPLIGVSERAPDGVENTIVFRTGDHWTMIYSEGLAAQHLARATSADLMHWKLEGPIEIRRQQWMSRKFGAPYVWHDGSRWLMILMGASAQDRTTFGLLRSTDGINWCLLPERNSRVTTP